MTGSDLRARRAHTARRRAWQPLWNDLEDIHIRTGLNHWSLAVSGGGDSRALMEAVASWPTRPTTQVLTIDHGTRPEAAIEVQQVHAHAMRLGLPCTIVTIASTDTTEAGLRAARRAALIAHTSPGDAIVLGHHETDVATSLLMAFAGEGGAVAAMPAAVNIEQRWWLRPFIARPQAELKLALAASHITDVVVDPGDARGDNARSRWQQHPLVQSHAAALARHAREVRELTEVVDGLLPSSQLPMPAPPAVVRRFVRAELNRQAEPGADLRSSNRVVDAVLRWRGGPAQYDLNGGVQARIERSAAGYVLLLTTRSG